MKKISRIISCGVLCVILAVFCSFNAFALNAENLSEGTYSVDATLSCYVNAMGGVEFGTPLLTGTTIKVDGSGNKTMTLNFTKSSVTIYNITCDTFVDASPSDDGSGSIKNGTIGYYDDGKNLQTSSVEYKLSDDTALNSKSEEVHYVSSISFPIESVKDTYELTLYINSNVMGVQFGAADSSSPATLTVDTNSLKSENSTSQQSEEYETLPNEINQQATTEVVVEDKKDDSVVEKDGLNIHYANGENADKSDEHYTAYLNMPLLWIMIAVSAVIIIAGIVLLVSSKFKRKRDNK